MMQTECVDNSCPDCGPNNRLCPHEDPELDFQCPLDWSKKDKVKWKVPTSEEEDGTNKFQIEFVEKEGEVYELMEALRDKTPAYVKHMESARWYKQSFSRYLYNASELRLILSTDFGAQYQHELQDKGTCSQDHYSCVCIFVAMHSPRWAITVKRGRPTGTQHLVYTVDVWIFFLVQGKRVLAATILCTGHVSKKYWHTTLLDILLMA
jgi:hypothetical protein